MVQVVPLGFKVMRAIYAIQGEHGGPVKIGSTRDPAMRLRELQAASPMPLRIVRSFPGNRVMESRLHDQLRHLRINGEWFRDEPELWEAFATAASTAEASAPSADVLDLATQLRNARLRANLTQSELAERLGCTPRAVWNWESGDRFPRPHFRRRIAEFFEEVAA